MPLPSLTLFHDEDDDEFVIPIREGDGFINGIATLDQKPLQILDGEEIIISLKKVDIENTPITKEFVLTFSRNQDLGGVNIFTINLFLEIFNDVSAFAQATLALHFSDFVKSFEMYFAFKDFLVKNGFNFRSDIEYDGNLVDVVSNFLNECGVQHFRRYVESITTIPNDDILEEKKCLSYYYGSPEKRTILCLSFFNDGIVEVSVSSSKFTLDGRRDIYHRGESRKYEEIIMKVRDIIFSVEVPQMQPRPIPMAWCNRFFS